MASAWGTSWGTSWGDSWGVVSGAAVVTTTDGGGNSRRRKRKRGTVIRYSDFESLDAYEKAMSEAMADVRIIPFAEVIRADPEEDDDDDLIRVLMTITVLH